MKKTSINKRITAVSLAAITTFSVIGTGFTTASAKTTGNPDMRTASVKSVGSKAGDAGISAANGAIDKLIEVACDGNPATAVLGAAGIGVIDSLFGNIFHDGPSLSDVDDHITRSTDEIVKDIGTLNTDMKTYHAEEMAQLQSLADRIDELSGKMDKGFLKESLAGFQNEDKLARSAHDDFLESIDNASSYISNTFAKGKDDAETTQLEKYKVVDKSTYNAFCDIVNKNRIAAEFKNMTVYLDEEKDKENEGVFDTLYTLEYNDYESKIDQYLTSDSKGIHTIDQLKNLPSFDETKNDLKGHVSDMVLYYIDRLQIAQMDYAIRNYKSYYENKGDTAELDKELSNSTDQLTKEAEHAKASLQSVLDVYNPIADKLDSQRAAEVSMTVNGTTYNFTVDNAMKGWFVMDTMTDNTRDNGEQINVSDLTFTLDKNWSTTDSDLGFYPNETYKNIVEQLPTYFMYVTPQNGYLLVPQDYGTFDDPSPMNFTLNLNGYSINTPGTDKYMFVYAPNSNRQLNMRIEGVYGLYCTIDNAKFLAATANNYLNLTIRFVTLHQRGDWYMFNMVGNGETHLITCGGTYRGRAVHSQCKGYWGNFTYDEVNTDIQYRNS